MDFSQLIARRESCRDYSDRPVAREELLRMVQAARLSPSACNSQPWKFVLCDGKMAEKIARTVQNPLLPINKWASQVSSFIIVCETPARLMKGIPVSSQHFAQLDLGLATAHLILAAEEQGLSTCIMGCFDEPVIKQLLSIPDEATVRLVIAVGYAATSARRDKVRKDMDQIMGINQW